LIRSSVGLGPSLAEAATACCLQRSQFARLFQRTMGASYGQFRLRLRLAHAAQLLRETEQQVEEVAARAGFADGSHLHRSFVQQYGCTPATYRQRAG
jgi:AraC-like DNA-binding protein